MVNRRINYRRAKQTKGVYCLECDWFGAKDRTSVKPALDLVQATYGGRVPHYFYKTATLQEFDFRLKQWAKPEFNNYPILYLGFHGGSGVIELTKDKKAVTLKEIATMLEGKCEYRIIHFGSCSTLSVHGNQINAFLNKTGALAVCGFGTDVDWLESAALDVLSLGLLQEISFTLKGIRKFDRLLRESALGLRNKLKFRIRWRSANH